MTTASKEVGGEGLPGSGGTGWRSRRGGGCPRRGHRGWRTRGKGAPGGAVLTLKSRQRCTPEMLPTGYRRGERRRLGKVKTQQRQSRRVTVHPERGQTERGGGDASGSSPSHRPGVKTQRHIHEDELQEAETRQQTTGEHDNMTALIQSVKRGMKVNFKEYYKKKKHQLIRLINDHRDIKRACGHRDTSDRPVTGRHRPIVRKNTRL